MRSMRRMISIVCMLVLVISCASNAETLEFGVVSKVDGIEFFEQSKFGCMKAAEELEGVECLYRAPAERNVRMQADLISKLIDEGADGLSIAIIQSEYAVNILQKAKEAGIPVITYNTDLDEATRVQYPDLRLAYIGTDNFELGRKLGEEVRKLRPDGGTVCIQTGRKTNPSFQQRVMGVRSGLTGQTYSTPDQKLDNVNGWTEPDRCPFYTDDDSDKARNQLKLLLTSDLADTFVSVVGDAERPAADYREMMQPFQDKLDNKDVVVAFTDSVSEQLDLLKERLAHLNVGQNPYEMGRLSVHILYSIVTGGSYEEYNYTDFLVCTPENADTCTK